MNLLFLLIPLFSFAHIITDDVATTQKARFSFASVCSKMVTHETPLIEVLSGTEIDCMGKRIIIGEFCEKVMAADPYYIRAYIERESKEVICVSGKKVIFKYLCVKLSDRKLCGQEAKKSCAEIQQKLAKRLDMVHFSYTKNEKGIKQLNCYFESLPLADKK